MHLVDTLAALVTASTLAAFALPSLQKSLETNRRATEVNRFVSAVHLARTEAVRRNATVVICPSADGTTCGARADWRHGWRLVARPPYADEIPLAVHLGANGTGAMANRTAFSFNPPQRRSTNGTVVFCTRHGADARAVVINHMGRPRLEAGKKVEQACAD